MQKISADYIYSPEGWLNGHLLEIDAKGVVQALRPIREGEDFVRLRGTLSPGFVNAHCHLELSMLQGAIPTGTGMLGFIGQVVKKRQAFSEGAQIKAAQNALLDMQSKGIVALGDICNTALTAEIKREHPAFLVYNFVERFGLKPEDAKNIIESGEEIAAEFHGLKASLSPHAPYSMSSELLQALYQTEPERISIHLLESLAERALFDEGTGPFLDFFAAIKAPKPLTAATHTAVHHISQDHPGDIPSLLVHNTEIKQEELNLMMTKLAEPWLCLCPLSNLYIHDRLPKMELFLPFAERICLGTDSLASNHKLDIWAEALTLKEYFPALKWHQLLSWASYNGAKALGFADQIGSFEKGKRPGVVLLPLLGEQGLIEDQEMRMIL
ncbi:MAG: amidohydrolase family protein [Bacteroidota bacterium]